MKRLPVLLNGIYSVQLIKYFSRSTFVFVTILLSLSLLIEFKSFGAQDLVKIMSYNLLNYPSSGVLATRNAAFNTSISSVNPDIVVVGEMISQAGMDGFLANVLNNPTSTYSAGIWINGTSDTENGIFYKTAKFQFVSNKRIITALRDINEFKLVHLLSGDTLRIYALHLKSSSTTSDELARANEVDSLRKVTNALPPGSNFIVCGDFNIYNSSESAYLKLLQVISGVEGHCIDPIVMTSTWSNAANAIRHTQSTRVSTYLGDGGSTGGLDDRFDMILYSKAISLAGSVTYVSNSTIAYGNDGNHYNDSINKMPNTAVSQAIANALYVGSDHLPVIASFNFEYGSVVPPDMGVLSLISPTSPMCSNANQLLQVQVKNFGGTDVNFAATNLLVALSATNPSAITKNFSKTISSGILTAGSVMTVTFDSLYNMTSAGSYLFNASTTITGDANNSNNAMPATTIVVNANPAAQISPPGPLSICNGSSILLTASAGSSFLWSTTEVTQAITVSSAGSYSVTITSANGCLSTSAAAVVSVISGPSGGTLFLETMGSVGGTTSISSHETANGFDNDNYTMTGSGDIRNTNASTGYGAGFPTASGFANAFLTSGIIDKNFIVSEINTSGLSNLQLSFGVFKSKTAANGSDLFVKVSSDGINYADLSFTAFPTGSGTATWHYRTASGVIPAVPNLRIQFINLNPVNDTAQYRIDDVLLTYAGTIPTINASGPTSFCQGDSVVLTASAGTNFLWNNGKTSQSITVLTSGSYSVIVDCISSSAIPVTVTVCSKTLNLKVMIAGYYLGGDSMLPIIDPLNFPLLCDTVTVALFDSTNLTSPVAEAVSTISTHGEGSFSFSPSAFIAGHKYYIIVRHRHSLETWSSEPILFDVSLVSYDFTSP